jgi:hypothetical protein
MRKLLALLLWALPLAAQTPVFVANPSFESAVTFSTTNANGSWELGTVPAWTGTGGVWAPNTNEYATLINGTQVLFISSGSETQDLGIQQQGTYSLTVQQGNRADGQGATASCTVSLGTATVVTPNSGIPLGTWQIVLLTYTPPSNPAGDLILSLSGAGGQCNFDDVSVTFLPAAPPAPYVFVLPNCGKAGSTCTFTFPIAAAPSLPACATADTGCYLSIQVCDTSVTPANCLTLSSSGTINIVVNSTTNPAKVPLVTATSP